jgi:Neuraminidase (sialidase)
MVADADGRVWVAFISEPVPYVLAKGTFEPGQVATDASAIYMIYTDDHGQTWSNPVKLNDDNTPTTKI